MENNGVVIPLVDPEMAEPAAPAAPQLDNSRPSQIILLPHIFAPPPIKNFWVRPCRL